MFFIVAFCLLSLCQATITGIQPTTVPIYGGTIIFITGYGFSSDEFYGCDFQGAIVEANYLNARQLSCQTPAVLYPEDITLSILDGLTIIGSTAFHFIPVDKCYQALSTCTVWGDPHFVPFCGDGTTYSMQPANSAINIVTSKDNRFMVHGKTTSLYLNGGQNVCNLNAISIRGTGDDGTLSELILVDNTDPNVVKVYLGGTEITPALPMTFNGIQIESPAFNNISVYFPGGEHVSWTAYLATLNIYLPGAQYWKNVVGLCGQIDAANPYCINSSGKKYAPGFPYLDYCANTWILGLSLKRSIVQNTNISFDNTTIPDNGTIFYQNTTIPDNTTILQNTTDPVGNATSFVVSDNFLSKAAKSICVEMFNLLGDICPPGTNNNLPFYESTCIYDGSAFLTNRFNQISPNTDVSTLLNVDVNTFIQNIQLLSETILDQETYSFMVSSVNSGLHDCFFRNLTFNVTHPEFDVNAFRNSLPGCSSYCKFPGTSCSADDKCQLSLTLEQLITLISDSGSTPTIPMNVILIIGSVLLLLSIW